MQTRVSIAMSIMMALAHYRADRKHQMRSLVETWHPPKAAQPPLDRKSIAAHDASEAMARLKSEKLPQPPAFTSCSRAFASVRLQLTRQMLGSS